MGQQKAQPPEKIQPRFPRGGYFIGKVRTASLGCSVWESRALGTWRQWCQNRAVSLCRRIGAVDAREGLAARGQPVLLPYARGAYFMGNLRMLVL